VFVDILIAGTRLRRVVTTTALIFVVWAAAPVWAETFTDVLGQKVSWESRPQRIVSLSPSLTEILFAIGCEPDVVVGITRFCNYPPITETIPLIGGIVDPSLEAILMAKPDLVLATRGNPLEFLHSLRSLSIPVYGIEANGDLELIINVVREVGRVTGRPGAADSLAVALEKRMKAVATRTENLLPEHRLRVYFGELDGAHWTPGPGSYVHSLLEVAGCVNVGAVATAPWSPLSLEVIIEQDPQVLIGTYTDADKEAATKRALKMIEAQGIWTQTSLGRSGQVIMIDADRILRPGPRVFDVLEEVTRTLYPVLWQAETDDTP
jgi:cobalamin transport system substrate-binding protein